jgi:hypothetical protein
LRAALGTFALSTYPIIWKWKQIKVFKFVNQQPQAIQITSWQNLILAKTFKWKFLLILFPHVYDFGNETIWVEIYSFLNATLFFFLVFFDCRKISSCHLLRFYKALKRNYFKIKIMSLYSDKNPRIQNYNLKNCLCFWLNNEIKEKTNWPLVHGCTYIILKQLSVLQIPVQSSKALNPRGFPPLLPVLLETISGSLGKYKPSTSQI